jgi:tetratricopeptide (TPR) repeat protein
VEATTVQTELKIARSYLGEAEAGLHAKADVIFELARRVYREPVPVPRTFAYGEFFGKPYTTEREKPPLDVGTRAEYGRWLDEAATPIFRDVNAALERLKNLERRYPGAALIEDGAPRFAARAMLAYGWLLLGDYYYYRCDWSKAARAYRNGFKLSPASQDFLYRLGLTHVNAADLGRAHNFLERAIELAPNSDVAVEAHKQLESLATLGVRGRVFRGSPAVLKTWVGVTIGGLVVCLSCICCGLLGGWAELTGEGDTGAAAAWTLVLVVAGGLVFLVPAVGTAIYYFVKRK